MYDTKTNTRKHTNHQREENPTTNTNINKTAEAAPLLASHTTNLAVKTTLSNIDDGAQYPGETWDGTDTEEDTSYRPLYYTKDNHDTARNTYQIAADHMAQLLAAN